jgi:hypothetical protein
VDFKEDAQKFCGQVENPFLNQNAYDYPKAELHDLENNNFSQDEEKEISANDCGLEKGYQKDKREGKVYIESSSEKKSKHSQNESDSDSDVDCNKDYARPQKLKEKESNSFENDTPISKDRSHPLDELLDSRISLTESIECDEGAREDEENYDIMINEMKELVQELSLQVSTVEKFEKEESQEVKERDERRGSMGTIEEEKDDLDYTQSVLSLSRCTFDIETIKGDLFSERDDKNWGKNTEDNEEEQNEAIEDFYCSDYMVMEEMQMNLEKGMGENDFLEAYRALTNLVKI